MQKCHRTVCETQVNKIWMHRQTKEYYCDRCTKEINKHHPGIVIRTVYSSTDLQNLGRILLEEAGLSDIDEERISAFISIIKTSQPFKIGVRLCADDARRNAKAND